MTQTYIVRLDDNTKFKVEDINTSELHGLLNQNKIFAVKIGKKSILKNLISYIAPIESFTSGTNNLLMNVSGEILYSKVDVIEQGIETLTNDLNKQAYVKLNEIVFNRGLFTYAEENTIEETVEEGETTETQA